MRENNSINFKFFRIVDGGLFEGYDFFDLSAEPFVFDFGRAFYIVTDEDYLTHKIEEADLQCRIRHIGIDGPVQIIYCPPTKEDIEAVYTMTPDIIIAGVYSSFIMNEGMYKDRKLTYHFFTTNKEEHCFTQEELIEKVCSKKMEDEVKKEILENSEIEFNDKGCFLRNRKAVRGRKISEYIYQNNY